VGDGGRCDMSNVVFLAEGLFPPRDKVSTTERRKLPSNDLCFFKPPLCVRRRGGGKGGRFESSSGRASVGITTPFSSIGLSTITGTVGSFAMSSPEHLV